MVGLRRPRLGNTSSLGKLSLYQLTAGIDALRMPAEFASGRFPSGISTLLLRRLTHRTSLTFDCRSCLRLMQQILSSGVKRHN
jgi:hypothetical protein